MKLNVLTAFAVASVLAIPSYAQTGSNDPNSSARGGADSSAGASAKKRGMKVRKGQTRDQAFQQLDRNGDGVISRDEAQVHEDVILLFEETDQDRNQMLTPQEFLIIPIYEDDAQ